MTGIKRFLIRAIVFTLAVLFIREGYADDDLSKIPTANIRLVISGGSHENPYYLCLPGVGCLSIAAGQKGQVFKMMTPFYIDRLYISDIANQRIYSAEAPTSCLRDIALKQTVTIKGNLVTAPKNALSIENLSCSVSSR
jgi:hypothetical protein